MGASISKNPKLNYMTALQLEALLCDLIAIESHEDAEGYEQAVVTFMATYLEKYGMDVTLIPVCDGRCNLIARLNGLGKGPVLILNGHTDTVPPYEMVDAFKAKVESDKIDGRGSVDMKGALAAMMGTMVTVAQSEVKLKGDLVFAATIGEETYSPGAFHLSESGFHADYAIVGEPTEMQIGIAHKGVQWYEIVFKGKAVHGSVPEKGINAVYKASTWIEWIRTKYIPALEKKQHALLGNPTINVGVIKGGTRPVIVPEQCAIQFERRMIPGENKQMVLAELNDILDAIKEGDASFEATVSEMPVFHGVPHPPLQADANSPLVSSLQKACADEVGLVAAPCGLSFWTDAALLARIPGLQAVVCGPGNIEQAHSNNEYISRSQLYAAMKIYTHAALDLCG